ncbi:MAG: thermonuclease family protein [Elusimicrobia bacterium]|nr:thermonuclease family protein [Elusimicrobiota bacterium]
MNPVGPHKMPESTLSDMGYTKLLSDLRKLWETGKAKAQRAVSRQLLQTYWEIGERIADEKLTPNAGYERSVMERLADDMRTDMTTLYRCVQFHEIYKTVPETEGLAWAHFRVLLTVKDEKERDFYTQQAEKNGWTRDQLLKAVQGDRYGEDKKGEKTKKLPRPTGATYVFKATVLDVVDGDTLVVDVDCGFEIKKKERIRLAGLDCPEILTDEGKEAAEYVRNQLARVPFVMIRTTKVDINGRFLGHIFYSLDDTMEKDDIYTDGRYLNQELLDKGFARLY